MNLPSSSPQPTPVAGGEPGALPELHPTIGLYANPQEALKSIQDYHLYWTAKLTESSFALSLALIGANWAVFGSVDKVFDNICAEISIALVILSLVIILGGNGWLGRLLRQRVEYAEQNTMRWQTEFNENAGKLTHWPSTRTIDWSAAVFRIAKICLPIIGGAFFLIALFTQPKAQKGQSHSGSLASPTPALSSPSATASTLRAQPSPR